MADNVNPYAPPEAHVEDVAEPAQDGFQLEGRGVAAGKGWGWIADAWRFTRGQRLVFLGVILVFSVLQIGVNFVPVLGSIAGSFLTPFLVAGFILGCESVRRGQPLQVDHLFLGFQRRYVNKLLLVGAVSFAMYIAMALVAVAILATTVGLAMFAGGPPSPEMVAQIWLPVLLAILVFLAMSVPATMALLYVPALVVVNDAEVIPAVRASFIACMKNVVPFLMWGVIGLVMFIVATTVFVLVGWFLVGALLVVSLYVSYRDIFYDA